MQETAHDVFLMKKKIFPTKGMRDDTIKCLPNAAPQKSKTLRYIMVRLAKSFFVKLFVAGIIILSIFSIAVYYFENNYTAYRFENGKRVKETGNILTLKDAVWWAFVTSTTVGYGDYYPRSSMGRLSGILLMFFGVSLVGVITGNIASILVEKQLKEERGLEELKLKNHFIICGWKRDMADVLHHIMERNRKFMPSEFVLVNTADPEEIENLKSDKRFSHINYIHGDYIDERVLNRANLKQAARIIVFADRLVKGSVQEVDSRTVMAVITIKSISKSVYTCAEILNEKFKRYLQISNCDEIILPTEYNKSIIANASAGSGISQVISELIDVRAKAGVAACEIPERFIGKSYQELFDYFMEQNRSILIGILENTGNFYSRKKEAIREAQKTPDISKLVDNLKEVKVLVHNAPVINPGPDYHIAHHTRAIIIEGREAEMIIPDGRS
jgi:voltage-gated potassium channel